MHDDSSLQLARAGNASSGSRTRATEMIVIVLCHNKQTRTQKMFCWAGTINGGHTPICDDIPVLKFVPNSASFNLNVYNFTETSFR